LIPVLDITGGGSATVPLADAVGGWEFHVSTSITLWALGLWDEGGNGLDISHEVGLWNSGQTLLATATVDNSSTRVPSISPEGLWLFTEIAPIMLSPGDYVLGAVWGNPIIGADPFRFGTTTSSAFGVSFTGSRAKTLLAGPMLVFPNEAGGLPDNGLFGPNMAVLVPEPPGALMLISGGVMCLALRRFRSSKAMRRCACENAAK
jgi:hypothetical protein